MNEVMDLIRFVFQTENAGAFAVSGTGRAAIEAAIVSLVEPGDRVIVGEYGRFGLIEIAERCGAVVVPVRGRTSARGRQRARSGDWDAGDRGAEPAAGPADPAPNVVPGARSEFARVHRLALAASRLVLVAWPAWPRRLARAAGIPYARSEHGRSNCH